MNIDSLLLILTVLAALWTVVGRSLLKATIGLAITSALISVIIFRLNSPLAAVFELSVCAGLITAVFASTISLTKPLTHKEISRASRDRAKRFVYLPIILFIVGAALMMLKFRQDFTIIQPPQIEPSVQASLWNLRRLDLLGQVIVLIAGALGVVILFREDRDDGK